MLNPRQPSASSGKQSLQVVVWEWENAHGRWRPYSPEVTQQLERAFMKNLRSVYLGDADPNLQNFCVDLSTWKQHCKKTNAVNKIRRSLYPQISPAGQGAVWQWAGDYSGDWHTYDMCVQCVLEDSWTSGAQNVDLSVVFPLCPYIISFCQLTQKNMHTNYSRTIRRKTQASYPIGRPVTPQQQANYPSLNTGPTPGKCGLDSYHQSQENETSKPKDDSDSKSKHDSTKARGLFNKVLNLAGSSSFTNNKNSGSNPPVNPNGIRLSQASAYPVHKHKDPMPLPRNSTPMAPIPKPRTLFPLQNESHSIVDQNTFYPQLPSTSQAGPSHLHPRMGSSEHLFGSNQTLDSDSSSICGNYPNLRRPSIETISTYLSLESISEDSAQQNAGSSTHSTSLKTGNLIQLNDSSDDEVFSECEDWEVSNYFMNGDASGSGNTSQEDSSYQMDYSEAAMNSSSHFVPISSPSKSVSPLEGAKRKKSKHNKPNGGQSSSGSLSSARAVKRLVAGKLKNSLISSKETFGTHEANSSSHFEAYPNNNNNVNSYRLKNAVTKEDKLIVTYAKAVTTPPNDTCSICMCDLKEESGYEETATEYVVCPVITLSICGHILHEECLKQLLMASPTTTMGGFLQCPICKTLHGEKWGNQPPGKMNIDRLSSSLPGFSGCGSIRITYRIHPGIQGPEHPNPGHPYYPNNFPRVAYLPDTEKGQKVLRLLQEAFRRRLTFTVGTSVTTNCKNVVTWNEIHHKTEWKDRSGHGYPDPNYLDNVLEELKSHGVVDGS